MTAGRDTIVKEIQRERYFLTKIVIKRLEDILDEHESEWEPMFKHWLKELKEKGIIEGIIEGLNYLIY